MPVLKEGARLAGRYTLVRRLGTGGMSEVWLARDAGTESPVALKFLLPELAAQSAFRERFRSEWRTGSRLMHPHIARVFEYHDEDDEPWYGQQYLEGPDIGVVTGEPPRQALRPFVFLADALRYAHAKGYVHRDVKAANVLLDRRGLPYLIDFGVAAAEGAAAAGGTAIAADRAPGEVRAANPAEDVYALGVLMHEVLTGRPPRPGADVAEAASAADGAPLDPALGELLADMLAPDADKRPAAGEVARRLEQAGIAAGPAAIAGRVAALPDEDEIVAEEIPALRRRAPAPGAAEPAAGRGGVPAKLALGGLAVLMVLVLSVVFVLPRAVEKRTAQPADEPAPVADTALPEEDAPPAEPRPAEDRASEAELRARADEALGALLSRLERLREQAVERWGGPPFEEVLAIYAAGDDAYLKKDYALAERQYREANERLEPFLGRVDRVFEQAMRDARAAFEARDHAEAVRHFDLAAAIRPGDAAAREGLARAKNLEAVLNVTAQALALEDRLELDAAKTAFERVLDLDPAWKPAEEGIARVTEAIRQRSFRQRMTEGFEALGAGDFATARAAFEAAKALDPDSPQPQDGLLQVDQEVRLATIQRLEQDAAALEEGEQWRAAMEKYEEILEVDSDLQFAREGLGAARQRAALHDRLQGYISDPDSLSAPATMQAATQLLLEISRIEPMGPRLEDEKNELSRLLKRAATPLKVQLVSDNETEVAIYRIGKLGTFSTRELELRPGSYVATGSRVGYRDVRLEFRVAPESELDPIVIMCEERI